MANWIERLKLSRRQALGVMGSATAAALAGCSIPGLGGKPASRLTAAGWEALGERIDGAVVPLAAADYESTRSDMVHHNGLKPRRFPDAIVRVASERDVQEAVKFAREHGLRVAVRGGGHNWNGASVRQGGILLDLSALNELTIYAANKTFTAQPVITGKEIARRLGEHGLAFPTGHCSTVPISGFLIGGGFGWNAGEWGVACWNVLGADAVLADGQLVHLSDSENADLFWAVRGGGMGFPGIVTRYHLKAYSLPRHIMSSSLVFPLEKAEEVAEWFAGVAPQLPRNTESVLLGAPAPPPLAGKAARVCMFVSAVFANSSEEARAALAPVAACPVDGALMKDLEVEETISSMYDKHDSLYPRGLRYAVESTWLAGEPASIVSRAAAQLAKAPSQHSSFMALVLPPPPADAPPMPECAFSMIGPAYIGNYAAWENEADDAANIAWHRETAAALANDTIGFYHNETDMMAEPNRAARAFAPANFERLVAIRKQYDPEGVFFSYLTPADDKA